MINVIYNIPSNLSPTIQSQSTTHHLDAIHTNRPIITSRKRKIEESDVENHDNGGKYLYFV